MVDQHLTKGDGVKVGSAQSADSVLLVVKSGVTDGFDQFESAKKYLNVFRCI